MLTLTEVQERLKQPFDIHLIKFKPGNIKGDECFPLAFVSWHHYLDRLDQDAAGLYSFPLPLVTIGPNKISVAASVIICGEIFSSVGDASIEKDNGVCDAEDQAFKRACAKAGLGRYLYDAKLQPVPFENKRILKHHLVLAVEMYDMLGLEVSDNIRAEAESLKGKPIWIPQHSNTSYPAAVLSSDEKHRDRLEKLKKYNDIPDYILNKLTPDQAREMQKEFMAKEKSREEILAPYVTQPSPTGSYRRPWNNN